MVLETHDDFPFREQTDRPKNPEKRSLAWFFGVLQACFPSAIFRSGYFDWVPEMRHSLACETLVLGGAWGANTSSERTAFLIVHNIVAPESATPVRILAAFACSGWRVHRHMRT